MHFLSSSSPLFLHLLHFSLSLYFYLFIYSPHEAHLLKMEESINSSSVDGGGFGSKVGLASSEESGWTMYFEDFMASSSSSEEKQEAGGFYSISVNGSSAISDAASCVAWTPLSLKKRKRKGLLDDDSLEDTASSPVSNPKVVIFLFHLLKQFFGFIPVKFDYRSLWVLFQEGVVGSKNDQEPKQAVNGFRSTERKNECTEQKKNGACLVPLSMLVHYLG
ncbi:hypothetical protein B296_00031503 [Ensete ventricosum]|uniref:Uncharacterized protein n=1 Tax=Ensete ventricosum TaxID=4639 RepID=A0A427AG57_ENSVE|nr:hypothetical protein B296_00031503 [Ensete ventricosum]